METNYKIYIGSVENPIFFFDGLHIETCSIVLTSSMSGEELAIDQFMPVVYEAGYIPVNFIPKGSDGLTTADGMIFQVYPSTMFLDKLPYGTPIWYYSGETLIGKFYSQRITRTGKSKFDVLAVSAVGVLDGLTHNGGIYTGQTFQTIVSDIIGNTVPFSCTSDVASIPVFGWLPKASKRSNLHQLLFACGVAAAKGAGGDIVFQFPDTTEVKSIPDNRIFIGGSIDYSTPASRADITEHTFMKLPSDESVTLFDNTDGSGVADHTTVDFRDAPIYDISADGLTVHESGVNYAVVSGTGVLTGRKYTHTTKIISITDANSDGKEKSVSVTDATLVSVANSEYVAHRVLSFYASAKTVSADIIVSGEKPGDQVTFTNPFDETETAFLSSMDMTASAIMRAACKLITNYTPKWFGNIYSHVIVLTGSGVWNKPEGAGRQGRAVLISGGSGGSSGGNGENGVSSWTTLGNPGKGGVAGQAGLGGKILSVTIDLENVSGFSYACGAGGLGGVANGTASVPGTAGGATIFGDYSSDDGAYSVSGCVNLFTGVIYGIPGMTGITGGDGCSKYSDGQEVVGFDGTVYFPGQRGQYESESGSGYSCWGDGGNGGGAAVGSNGGDGGNGNASSNQGHGYGTGGGGGKGADAANGVDGTTYGCGGSGGHGGGGGGVGGEAYCSNGKNYYNYGNGGNGGAGGNGGKGSDGCILIYY